MAIKYVFRFSYAILYMMSVCFYNLFVSCSGILASVNPKNFLRLVKKGAKMWKNKARRPEQIRPQTWPLGLKNEIVHCYEENSFVLCGLPIPKPGKILGLVGANGIGKTTAINILGGRLKPNLGPLANPLKWTDINLFQNSELKAYFDKVINFEWPALVKPQNVNQTPSYLDKTIQMHLNETMVDKNIQKDICQRFGLEKLRRRKIKHLSSGELQRFECALLCLQIDEKIYLFDEFSSHLDLKQKFRMASEIKSLISSEKYVVVVDHDLAILDYLTDSVCCFHGIPGVQGVVTMPFSVREGINLFLNSFIPFENSRFRGESFFDGLQAVESAPDENNCKSRYKYREMSISIHIFQMDIKKGEFFSSEIILLLGENGSGKTTFIKSLAKQLKPGYVSGNIDLSLGYNIQKFWGWSEGTVKDLLEKKINSSYLDEQFVEDVIEPLKIFNIINKKVSNLSGEEMQRVAITLCLGTPAHVYLIDEPSIDLDCEMRLIAAKVIKRFIITRKKAAFIAEHDFIMATYLADRVILFEGVPSVMITASPPQSLLSAMNKFLKKLDVTCQRDPNNFRFWFNKGETSKDAEQKRSGQFFFFED